MGINKLKMGGSRLGQSLWGRGTQAQVRETKAGQCAWREEGHVT